MEQNVKAPLLVDTLIFLGIFVAIATKYAQYQPSELDKITTQIFIKRIRWLMIRKAVKVLEFQHWKLRMDRLHSFKPGKEIRDLINKMTPAGLIRCFN